MGLAATVLGGYAVRQSMLYVSLTGDLFGGGVFGLAGVGLWVVAVAHFYMAAGYRFGRVEFVTGSLSSATLRTKSKVIAEGVSINFLRKPDADDLNATPDNRYVFFISGWRPWVCPESGFLMD